jgi:hypothetical protein
MRHFFPAWRALSLLALCAGAQITAGCLWTKTTTVQVEDPHKVTLLLTSSGEPAKAIVGPGGPNPAELTILRDGTTTVRARRDAVGIGLEDEFQGRRTRVNYMDGDGSFLPTTRPARHVMAEARSNGQVRAEYEYSLQLRSNNTVHAGSLQPVLSSPVANVKSITVRRQANRLPALFFLPVGIAATLLALPADTDNRKGVLAGGITFNVLGLAYLFWPSAETTFYP